MLKGAAVRANAFSGAQWLSHCCFVVIITKEEVRMTPRGATNHQLGLGHLQLFRGASPCWWEHLSGACRGSRCLAPVGRAACKAVSGPLLCIFPQHTGLSGPGVHATHGLRRRSQRPELGGWGLRIYRDLPITAMRPWKNHFTFLHLEFPHL